MRYSIEGQELTDIANALRRRHGESSTTYTYELMPEVKISKSINAISFTEWDGEYAEFDYIGAGKTDVVTIEGADKLKVKMSYQTFSDIPDDYISIDVGTVGNTDRDHPYRFCSDEISTIELEFDGDTINFLLRTLGDSSIDRNFLGYYAEITGYKKITTEIPNTYQTKDMAQAIDDIPQAPPEEAFILSGSCNFKFAGGGWDWFIDLYSDKIITKDITNCNNMFNGSQISNIPFDINMSVASPSSACEIGSNMYYSTSSSLQPANMYITTTIPGTMVYFEDMSTKRFSKQFIFVDDNIDVIGFYYSMFQGMKDDEEEEPTWVYDLINYDLSRSYTSTKFGGRFPVCFSNCYKIKTLPSLKKCWSNNSGYYGVFYGLNLTNCFSLQSVVLPRPAPTAAETSNQFGSKFQNMYTIKHFTFDVQEDGSPYVAQWKSQTLDLCAIGTYASGSSMDPSKAVTDEESYQRLKNDPAWYNFKTSSFEYSPFNHDSAVETINSLPDTSAYLAEKGGTNTIKFRSAAGSLTDGGAINTLTAEEIAVATAKGWTVTLT